MKVTIKELAQMAGVSKGTVDRALHNRPGVNADVALHIKALAAEMGFSPNRAGRILSSRKQPVKIACIFPGIGNAFYTDVEQGYRDAAEELRDFGITVECIPVKAYHVQDHVAAVAALMESDLNALCISTVDDPKIRQSVNQMVEKGIPVITVNNDLTDTRRMFYVGCDYYQAGCTAAGVFSFTNPKQLNFLLVSGTRTMKNHNWRLSGFTDTLDGLNRPYRIVEHIETSQDEEAACTLARSALSAHPEINCVYMISAGISGVCRAIKDLGLAGKLFVLSYDDIPVVRQYMTENVISYTLCQEPWLQGYKAIYRLFDYFVSNKQIIPEDYLTKISIKIKQNLG